MGFVELCQKTPAYQKAPNSFHNIIHFPYVRNDKFNLVFDRWQ